VTEKLIDGFVVGSVPIHMGVDDLTPFVPRKNAALNMADFSSPQEMATYMKFLLSNRSAYEELLSWKLEGTTRAFRSTMDLSVVHSACRMCIRLADMNRWQFDWNHDLDEWQNPYSMENKKALASFEKSPAKGKILRVRERGFFWFHLLVLKEVTMKALVEQIRRRMGPYTEFYEAKMVRRTPLDPITTIASDDALRALPNLAELEVVLFFY